VFLLRSIHDPKCRAGIPISIDGTCYHPGKISRLLPHTSLEHHVGMNTPQSGNETLDSRIPTVGCVANDTIIELIYDPDKRKTGLAVSRHGGLWNIEQEVRIHTGETLIPYSAKNNLITNDCVLLPSKPEHHGDKAELLADIMAFLHRYVDLSPPFEQIAAHYILLSWVHDAFNEMPYLRLRGEYGTGKTRGLLAIGSLCYRPFFASGASTVSPVFHTLDRFGGTLILDEADFRFSDATSEIVKILNNGNVKGLPVLRTMQNRDKEFNPRAFRVFGPKIIAMRGNYDDPALESRFITEDMGLRPMRKDIPIAQPSTLKEEALVLRNRLLHFRFCHLFSTKSDPRALLTGVEPRVNQIALPLLSLVDDAAVRAEIVVLLMQERAEQLNNQRETAEARVLAVLREAFVAANGEPVSIGVIADRFNAVHGSEYGQPVSDKWIGYVVRKGLRLSTSKSKGVYIVPTTEKPKIDALSARYT